FGEEGAVTTVLRLHERDVRIRSYLAARFRQDADEWIVDRVQDERWVLYVLDHSRSRCAIVVVVCADESAVTSGDLVVELAHTVALSQHRDVKDAWIERCFPLHAPTQMEDKFPFVEAVLRFMQCVAGRTQIHRRRHRGKAYDFLWS